MERVCLTYLLNDCVHICIQECTCLWDQPASPLTTLRSSSLALEMMLGLVVPLSSDLVACCTPSETIMAKGIGNWRYPNGTHVPGGSGSNSASRPFVSLRNVQSIKLVRRESVNPPPLSPTGSYCCTIPTTGGEMIFCANLGEWFFNLGFHPQSDSVSSCVPVSPTSDQWNSLIQPLNTGSEYCGHLHLRHWLHSQWRHHQDLWE